MVPTKTRDRLIGCPLAIRALVMMSMDHPVPITLMHARSGSGRVVWSSAFDFEMSIIDRGGNNKEPFEELRARGKKRLVRGASLGWLT